MNSVKHKNKSFASTISMLRPRVGKGLLVFFIALIIGMIAFPLLIGALLGYIYGYNRFMRPQLMEPNLFPLPVPVWVSVVIGAFAFPVLIYTSVVFVFRSLVEAAGGFDLSNPAMWVLVAQFIISFLILGIFGRWQGRMMAFIAESKRHGSARFATEAEVQPYRHPKKPNEAIYIGGGLSYDNRGHITTVAGTRTGKGANLVVPTLLGAGGFDGSIVVVDPKAENAAITTRYQRERGKNVRNLNPWGLHGLESSTYNPLDLMEDTASENLPDNASVIAQMIVPTVPGKDSHWDNRARSLITAILLYMAVALPKIRFTLGELWRLLRLPREEWLDLLKEMALNQHPVSGPIINGAANEIISLIEDSEKEAAGVISTAQRWTDIFKSIPLRRSLESSSFSISELSEGNTVLYITIPADKLKTHYAWLRLVVTTAMRAVIRQPKERVLFILDEAYALGYLPELQVGMGTYSGFGISIWSFWQALPQLQELYGKNWENFIGNSAVFHAFGLNDHTSAKYISDMIGQTSVPNFTPTWLGPQVSGASARPLVTPDEVRRTSDAMYVFLDRLPPAVITKQPYYTHPVWSKRADPNPYFKQ